MNLLLHNLKVNKLLHSSLGLGKRFFSQELQYLKVTKGNPSQSKSDGNILWVTMNKPELHNAFNENIIEEITRVFKEISLGVNNSGLYSGTRAVVFTGSGASFSAGADLNWMKKMATYTVEQNERDSHALFDMVHTIRNCPCPIIARVNGNAFGGGSGLIAACDISYSLNSAKFGFTEVKLGLIPAVISPFVVEKIGRAHASRYFLTGERFGPEEAKRIGLISDVFNSEKELDEAVEKTCKEIASSGPKAVSACKALIRNIAQMDWNHPFTKIYVSSEIAKARVSEEGQSGLSAFLNKGKPSWLK